MDLNAGPPFGGPAFRRMIADIEARKVNMVITKDLSRLGRDYIMTGHYMERYVPEHQVRYISLLDGIVGQKNFEKFWKSCPKTGVQDIYK